MRHLLRLSPMHISTLASVLMIGFCLSTVTVQAATPAGAVQFSADITVNLSGQTAADEDVLDEVAAGVLSTIDIGTIPGNVDVIAYHEFANGDRLFVLDISVRLNSGLHAGPGDVVRFDGSVYSLAFAGSVNNLPPGAAIDALSADAGGRLLLSFDVSVKLGAVIVDDEDLVRFDGNGFSLFFDASAVGVDPSLDLDAVHYLPDSGQLLLSFDGSGAIATNAFDDEDILQYDPGSNSWSLAFDGSSKYSGWSVADLDATHFRVFPDAIFHDHFESGGSFPVSP